MNIGTLTWNGYNSLTDFGVYISGTGAHNAAEADVTAYQIPGRSGDLIISNDRYKNIEVRYPAFIAHGFAVKEQGVRNWLRSAVNYRDLTDTYDQTHYRKARPTGELEFSPVRPDGANFEIVFDCDPRRFLLAGETDQTFTNDVWSDTNPTGFPAKPLLILTDVASGLTLDFYDDESGRTITLTATAAHAGDVVIDCETQDIFDYSTLDNLNTLFTLSGDFPVLGGGFNSVTITGTYTTAIIRPRWWEL